MLQNKTVLTEGEADFLINFLEENGCGAKTAGELLADNFSCQCIEDLRDTMKLSVKQVGGFLSSLQEKSVIYIEDERGSGLPDLYWVSDSFLEELKQDASFREAIKTL